jgi:K(+)-stimulated pyrophosphate-energized sodium pump
MTSIGASSILYATLAGGIGLLFVIYLVQYVMKKDPGDDRIQELSGAIYEGAMAFLRREYKVVLVFIAVLFVVLLFAINTHTAIAFLVGAATSVSAGYVGMKIATAANGRTTQAATGGFNEALRVAFPGGAVMGMFSACSSNDFVSVLRQYEFKKLAHFLFVIYDKRFACGSPHVTLLHS